MSSAHYEAADRLVRFMPSNHEGKVRRIAQHVEAAVDVVKATAKTDLNEALDALLPFARYPFAGDATFDDPVLAARDVIRKYRPQEEFE